MSLSNTAVISTLYIAWLPKLERESNYVLDDSVAASLDSHGTS